MLPKRKTLSRHYHALTMRRTLMTAKTHMTTTNSCFVMERKKFLWKCVFQHAWNVKLGTTVVGSCNRTILIGSKCIENIHGSIAKNSCGKSDNSQTVSFRWRCRPWIKLVSSNPSAITCRPASVWRKSCHVNAPAFHAHSWTIPTRTQLFSCRVCLCEWVKVCGKSKKFETRGHFFRHGKKDNPAGLVIMNHVMSGEHLHYFPFTTFLVHLLILSGAIKMILLSRWREKHNMLEF